MNQSIQQYELENQKLNEKLFLSQQECENLHTLLKSEGEELRILQQELSGSVSREEFQRLEQNYEEISNDFYAVREQLKRAQDKLERLAQEKEELERERKKLFDQMVQLESSLNDKARDLELKDIKIESLSSVIARRDAQLENSGNVGQFEERVRGLETDKEKLIRDNVTLIRENEHLKEQVNYTLREEHERIVQAANER